jgi:hypothetical protein
VTLRRDASTDWPVYAQNYNNSPRFTSGRVSQNGEFGKLYGVQANHCRPTKNQAIFWTIPLKVIMMDGAVRHRPFGAVHHAGSSLGCRRFAAFHSKRKIRTRVELPPKPVASGVL